MEVKNAETLLVYNSTHADNFDSLSRVGLTSWWTTEQERHLTVGHGLLGQIVINDNSVLAVVTEPFAHSTPGEGSDVLKRSSFRGGSCHNDTIFHGVVLLKCLDQLSHSRSLLSDGNVDTVELLGLIVGVIPPFLVKNSIESNSRLSGLTIADDQLTLTTSNRNHSVNGFETGLDWLVDRVTRENARSLKLSSIFLLCFNFTLPIDRISKCVDDTTEDLRTNGNINLLL